MARTPSPEYLIVDIETVPDVERWKRPDVMGDTSAPVAAGHVDPATGPVGTSATGPVGAGPVSVGAPVATSSGSPPSAQTSPPPQRADRAGFPPTWAHRIVVLGYLWLDHGYRLKRLGTLGGTTPEGVSPDQSERALLEDFGTLVGRARPTLVTYNGRSFDLPVIALRSLCHGVPLWYYRERNVRARYSEDGHLDLCDWLADHGATRSSSLDALARLIGLPGKVGVDGSQVEGLYRAGQLADIERYCLADVAQTALLFLRFRLLQGALEPERYREVAAALLDALATDGRVSGVLDGTDRAHLIT